MYFLKLAWIVAFYKTDKGEMWKMNGVFNRLA